MRITLFSMKIMGNYISLTVDAIIFLIFKLGVFIAPCCVYVDKDYIHYTLLFYL